MGVEVLGAPAFLIAALGVTAIAFVTIGAISDASTAVGFFIASIIVSALAPFALEVTLKPYPVGFLVGIIPVVSVLTAFLALPVYLKLSMSRRTQLIPLLGAAFLAGFCSCVIFGFFHADFEKVNGVVLIRHGWRTLAGWHLLLEQSLLIGATGIAGGLGFWLVQRVVRTAPQILR
jgi:hypothetical protein